MGILSQICTKGYKAKVELKFANSFSKWELIYNDLKKGFCLV